MSPFPTKIFPWMRTAALLLSGLALGGCRPKPAVPLWNVPALIGQPIQTAENTLGKPQSETVVSPGVSQGQWKKDDVTLTATWKTSNGRVTGYQIISRDDDHAVRDSETTSLLVPGQLKEGDPAYSTEWIESASKTLFYTGVKVTPAPKTHAVTIRVTGGEALLDVIYEATGPGGKSETITTIAPWYTSFTLADDAKVTLTAGVSPTLNSSPGKLGVEIEVDGKVVASQNSGGTMVTCSYEL